MRGSTIAVVAIIAVLLIIVAVAPPRDRTFTGDRRIVGVDGDPIALASPDDVPDPVQQGEIPPPGFRQVLSRDDIAPVYEPEFLPADEVDWDDDALVIGLEIDGQAKVYPVSFLNRREMVIDRLAGIPILVTW